MPKKVYFVFILLFTLFSSYYQYIVSSSWQFIPIATFIRDMILIFAGLSLYFQKVTLSKNQWNNVYKFVLAVTIGLIVYQILPISYFGNFSPLNGSLMTNILVVLFFLALYLPLYSALYKLSHPKNKK